MLPFAVTSSDERDVADADEDRPEHAEQCATDADEQQNDSAERDQHLHASDILPHNLMTAHVRDNAAAHRYELDVDGHVAFVAYRDTDAGDRMFAHTEVPQPLEGQGIGGRLVKGALEAARAEGRRIIPSCPFVRAYIDRHPEYEDLVAN